MRILIIHNRYQDPGGEDTVVSQEKQLLGQTEDVMLLTFQNRKGWQGMWQTLWSPWNVWAARKVRRAIRQHHPDVVHLHNLHYAVGPIAIRVVKRANLPVVMTLHNYRLLCPSATLFHNGRRFTDSLHAAFPWKAVRLGVHSRSRVKTFWLALNHWVHRKLGTWRLVDRYITLTDFARQLFIDSSLGLPVEKFTVKPNFTIGARPAVPAMREDFFLFVGRLTEEKGIPMLLEAFATSGLRLTIVGDGPLRKDVLAASDRSPSITYLGPQEHASVARLLASCTALVFPSVWYEGMPMTLLEAFAAGTPVIASDLGAMASMVKDGYNGWLFSPGDASALREKAIRWAAMDPVDRQPLEAGAGASYETLYTAAPNRQQLLGIYQAAINDHQRP